MKESAAWKYKGTRVIIMACTAMQHEQVKQVKQGMA
jgi:hypothetical protein